MSERVKMFPGWYKELRKMNSSAREKLIEIVLENIRRDGDLKDQPTLEGTKLVQMLKRECEFVGFAPNVTYLKCQGKKDELQASFVHPWAMTTLVYKHKKLPILIYANAGMRKDQMLLAELPFNQELLDRIEVIGLTS